MNYKKYELGTLFASSTFCATLVKVEEDKNWVVFGDSARGLWLDNKLHELIQQEVIKVYEPKV